jgi:hypothetical protein
MAASAQTAKSNTTNQNTKNETYARGHWVDVENINTDYYERNEY